MQKRCATIACCVAEPLQLACAAGAILLEPDEVTKRRSLVAPKQRTTSPDISKIECGAHPTRAVFQSKSNPTPTFHLN
eukprot:scaffold1081_cov136-Amphora_coffeaeformis.AAC.4